VVLEDGQEFDAPVVVSALDPRRTFTQLVDPRELPTDLVEAIGRFRFQGTSAKVNFALDGLPQFPALAGRDDHFRGFTNIGPSMEYLERAFDEGKYGWYSSRPYLDCAIQSTIDPDMAPPGKHVMSCFVQYAPYHLKGSDWDTERQNLGDTIQRTVESFFPGFSDLILHREVVPPLDIERGPGLSEGNIFAGEFLAPQMYSFRPAPGYADYRTPITGYYQCGSGTHPGGCVMGAPGKMAAQRIVKDRETGRAPKKYGRGRSAARRRRRPRSSPPAVPGGSLSGPIVGNLGGSERGAFHRGPRVVEWNARRSNRGLLPPVGTLSDPRCATRGASPREASPPPAVLGWVAQRSIRRESRWLGTRSVAAGPPRRRVERQAIQSGATPAGWNAQRSATREAPPARRAARTDR
jgi:hypothetical protein